MLEIKNSNVININGTIKKTGKFLNNFFKVRKINANINDNRIISKYETGNKYFVSSTKKKGFCSHKRKIVK